jgi:uncharacterized protein
MRHAPKSVLNSGESTSGGSNDPRPLRVILDTNVLLSALIRRDSIPASLLQAWHQNRYDLLTHTLQLQELRTVTRRDHIRRLVRPAQAGRLVNQLRTAAVMVDRLPRVQRSEDPADDFLLAVCEAGAADYLVTGDRGGLLVLERHGATQIVTARTLRGRLGQ